MKKLVYIAGKLNDNADGYIRNLHRMIKTANAVRNAGFVVYIPGLDFLEGLVDGSFVYNQYFDNSQPILKRCDAIFLTPGWEDSLGTQDEICNVHRWGVPVFDDVDVLQAYFDKPLIICIVGESGSGKTKIAEYIEQRNGIKMIQSYTDRDRRKPDENGHTFISPVEFAELDRDNMIAFTEWADEKGVLRHYCCLKSDVQDKNTYVIDERGLCYLKRKFSRDYDIVSIRIRRPKILREDFVGKERVARDEGKFFLPDEYFDYVIYNASEFIDELYEDVDSVIDDILK